MIKNLLTICSEAIELVSKSSVTTRTQTSRTKTEWTSRSGELRKGSDILIDCLLREGVQTVFAYPGGASMEIHQALTRTKRIRNILCRHEQGEIFAAEGFAKATGEVGVCIATSGPGATNLVTGLADALLDSVPLVAITGQVPRKLIGSDAFQETPIVEVTRQITKHNYLVMNIEDLPRVVKEAFFLARSGRPGPVLLDIPKDVQQQMDFPKFNQQMQLSGYIGRLPGPPDPKILFDIVETLSNAKQPLLYVGGGALHAADEVTKIAKKLGIPVTNTLMGLGAFPGTNPLSLNMLGMHGTVYANYSVDQTDLLLALGVRFDDRVTGKLETFASKARIVHVDIDTAEIHKNKHAHIPLCADLKLAIQLLLNLLEKKGLNKDYYRDWRSDIEKRKSEFPMRFFERKDIIIPQVAIQILRQETRGQAIISTGVGQHQMWAAQMYHFDYPRRWLTSGGLGTMGFGLPSAIGAASAFDGINGKDKRAVVDIDGDGSFTMNCQELATVAVENLDTKILILNNQHLGMVVQWEDRFYKANRAHTFLGIRGSEWHKSRNPEDIFPNFVLMAEAFRVKARRVISPDEIRSALDEMLKTKGPFLIDTMVPHVEHVLPMIPGGGSYKDIIVN